MGKHRHVLLTEEDRILLQKLIRGGESSARVQTRARVLLLCDRSEGKKRSLAQVSDSVLCSMGTVRNIKRNYFAGGMEAALYEKPRPGIELTFTGESLRQDYEYERHSVADLFLSVEPLRGHRQVRVRDHRPSKSLPAVHPTIYMTKNMLIAATVCANIWS